MEELSGVVISFDLEMSLLDIYFEGGSNNRNKAYDSIKKFLISQEYEHLEDSDYKNDEDSINIALKKILQFCEENKWFPLCVKKLIITPNSLYCDYTDILRESIDQDYKDKMENAHSLNEKTVR